MNVHDDAERTMLYGRSTQIKQALARSMRLEPTEAERLLWYRLKGNRVANLRFRRQQPILGFVVDFYCHALRLIVEVDGPVHDEQRAYDNERDAIFRSRGYTILRFTNDDVYTRREWVVYKIRTRLNV